MRRTSYLFGCALFVSVEALRQQSGQGQVEFTYTFGAPGSASPALQNTRGSNPCFPGLRVWMTSPGTFGSKWTDFVAGITNAVSYYHSTMDAEDITEDRPQDDGAISCYPDIVSTPNVVKPSTRLHGGMVYIEQTRGKLDPLLANFTFFGRTENMKNPAALAESAKPFGWRVVGANWGSILLQNPDTLDCVVTFRGTDGTSEWLGNANTAATHFCGLTNENDSCDRAPCTTSKPRGSFAHMGFTERLRSIVSDNGWQNQVRKNLGSCRKVYAAGHSAGGAMAELFQACLASAPREGEFGHGTDYRYMSWVKGTPQRLPYM